MISSLTVLLFVLLTVVVLKTLYPFVSDAPQAAPTETVQEVHNPLIGKKIYRDDTRLVTLTERKYRQENRSADADALKAISDQPGTTWLVGPNSGDLTAKKDIDEVIRTSTEAAAQGTTPVYQLYAIPERDTCAAYSQGGFSTPEEYLQWIDRILASVKTPSVFLVETDSIGTITAGECMTGEEIETRETLLKTTVEKLRQSSQTLTIYLDAGHSEWFPDPSALVGPLKKSGIDSADGVFVNTSFFATTEELTAWSKRLLDKLGGNKGVIIDTSRNGNGVPEKHLDGEQRWCNPDGRSIGASPTVATGTSYVHAYLWIKNVGESDGSCAGFPAAGTFVPELAIDLVRNRR